MRPGDCRHEETLIAAIASGSWPDEADPTLRAHVAGCAVCRDLAAIVPLLRDDRLTLCVERSVPSAGAVWWRARVRARAEAEQAAMQPMLVAAAWAVTVLVALIAVVVTLGWPWGQALVGEGLEAARRLQPTLHVSFDLTALVPRLFERWLVPVLLAGLLLLATPLALYVAARE